MNQITVDKRRYRQLNEAEIRPGPVIYWMSRDQRIADNWALLHAQQLALDLEQPLAISFCLVPEFLGATLRQYDFMLKGLAQVETACRKKNIPFFLRLGDPAQQLANFAEQHSIGAVICDFNPLRISRKWKRDAATALTCPLIEVDAHNIIPCWEASDKQEFAARTLRPKIHKKLPEFLTDLPTLRKHPHDWPLATEPIDWNKARDSLKIDTGITPVTRFEPGEKAAGRLLQSFIKNKLGEYDNLRNDPNASAQSDLSPYLHFGQISPQRVTLEIIDHAGGNTNSEAFIEELVVRRELSDNFCFYNDHYDSFAGFPEWAQKTLDKHRNDTREYVYSHAEFESAATHDPLWNAAQVEMVTTGKMHGYMRMYWAKKILEWSLTPEDALATAIHLNDRYELDGRDPNGYAGVAWSIGGVHDRPWGERSIFGMVRFMAYSGCKRKFNVDTYIRRYLHDQADLGL